MSNRMTQAGEGVAKAGAFFPVDSSGWNQMEKA